MKHTDTGRGRNIVAALLCAAFTTVAAFPIGVAFANDHEDKWFNVYTDQNVTWTPAENKDDCTSSWQQNNSLSCGSAECFIDAANGDNSPIEVNSPRYGWNQYQTGFLDNYVKEHGNYPSAILYFRANAPVYSATGYWSPDCIYCPPCP